MEDCFKRLRKNNGKNRTSVEDEKKKLVMEPCDKKSGTPLKKLKKFTKRKIRKNVKKKMEEKLFLSNIEKYKKIIIII